jgi:HlyD family secretion protein
MPSSNHRLPASLPESVPAIEAAPSRRKQRRGAPMLAWIGPLLLLLAAGAYFSRGQAPVETAAAEGVGPTSAAVAVSLGDISSTVRVTGTVVAERYAAIRAPRILGSRGDFHRGGEGAHDHGAAGHSDFTLTILRIEKGGTPVEAGDVIVEFDAENQAQRVDDYRDSVVQLKSSIRKMIANLAASKEEHEQKVRTAWANWQKALLDVKTVAVRSSIDAEKLRLSAEEGELTYRQLAAEQALVEESQQASIRSSELVLARAAIEVERAQNNVKRMTITAPIDGVVVTGNVVLNGELRPIRDGDQVSAGQPVLSVVDTGSMALNAAANQVDAQRMRLGMSAAIQLDAYPELNISGTLVGVGAMAKVSTFRASYVGEIPLRFRIQGRDSRLLPDLTGSADVILHSESNVLLAPRPALFTENGRPFVFVQGHDNWIRKPVETGLQSATHVAIRAGLRPGEIVALERPL